MHSSSASGLSFLLVHVIVRAQVWSEINAQLTVQIFLYWCNSEWINF